MGKKRNIYLRLVVFTVWCYSFFLVIFINRTITEMVSRTDGLVTLFVRNCLSAKKTYK